MKAIFRDGRSVQLTEHEGQRTLYALSTLAVTPLALHLNVLRIEDETANELWPCNTGKSEVIDG